MCAFVYHSAMEAEIADNGVGIKLQVMFHNTREDKVMSDDQVNQASQIRPSEDARTILSPELPAEGEVQCPLIIRLKCKLSLQLRRFNVIAVKTFTFENEIYFENQIILEFHPPTEFARDTVLYIVVRSLSSEHNVIQPIKRKY